MSPPAPVRPLPQESLERCAARAELRGDPLIGTAFPAARVLLVEQPGPWGRAGLRESRFDRVAAAALERRANAAGVRVLAVRRPGRPPVPPQANLQNQVNLQNQANEQSQGNRPGRATQADRPNGRRWMLADSREGSTAVRGGTFTDDAELLELPLDGIAGAPIAGPLFLVCAHGKHDACCALRGRPVAAALDAVRPGQVWECSHVGGDRFAANVLVLPAGLLYGRVLAIAAEQFAAAADADEVVGALLRGHIGLAPPAQAALAFGYEHLAVRRRSDVRLVSVEALEPGVTVVTLAGPNGRIEVVVRAESMGADGLTCAGLGPGSFIAHRVVSVAAVG